MIRRAAFGLAIVLAVGAATGTTALLDRTVGECDCRDHVLRVSLDSISRDAGVPIVVDWNSFEDRVTPTTVSNVWLSGCTVRDAIRALLEPCEVSIDTGVIRVVAAGQAKWGVRTYAVGDLAEALGREGGEQLVRLVQTFVRPDDWADNGGKLQIYFDQGSLIAEQTAEGHEQIARLLQSLRECLGQVRPVSSLPSQSSDVLNRPVPAMHFAQAALEDVLTAIRLKTHAAMIVRWDRLECAAIEPANSVTLDFPPCTLRQALDLLTREYEIGWTFHHGAVEVTSQDSAAAQAETRMLDVAPVLELESLEATQGMPSRPDLIADSLMRLCEDAQATDSWVDNGGATGRLMPIGTLLVVANAPRALDGIAVLMSDIRSASAPSGLAAPAPQTPTDPTDAKVGDMDLTRATLESAIDALGVRSRTQILVNWKSLEAAGVSPADRVNIRITNGTLASALHMVLEQAGGANAKLGFAVDEMNIVHVGTMDAVNQIAVTRIYNVRDLIDQYVRYRHAASRTVGRQGASPSEAIDSLTQIIESSIQTDSWRDNGGSVGAIREFGGLLVITNTTECHKRITTLLDTLRTTGRSARTDWLHDQHR